MVTLTVIILVEVATVFNKARVVAMVEAATRQHAHPNTVFHCLYAYYYLGYNKSELAHVFNKSPRTIDNWIRVYETTGTYQRISTTTERRFSITQRQWLRDFFAIKPLSYLDEAQTAFHAVHRISISKSSMWRIIHDFGMTRKVLERRAMHIKERDVFRFAEELPGRAQCGLLRAGNC